jgi:ABC-type multidrug transport system ATPase subunit/pSer/pThr/pTyr-binding forkhead associated (FHA) protein
MLHPRMTISCPRCRAQMPDQAAFCTGCGLAFAAPGAVPQGAVPQTGFGSSQMGSPAPNYGASQMGAPAPAPLSASVRSDARTMALDASSALSALGLAGGGLSEVTIGRDPACTIVIDNPVVSGRHARITRQRPSGLLVEDFGSTNGTFVNGRRVAGSQVISLADDLRVGSVPVALSDARIAGMVLRVARHPSRGQAFIVGSSATADVVIDDPEVAPQHAQLTEGSDGLWVVKNLNAPNGTFVDNASYRIEEARVPGTGLILLGRFALPLRVLGRLLEDPSGTSALADAVSRALASLDKPLIHIGRAPENELVLPHPTVSQRHARLQRQADGSLLVTDLGSTNGTFVDGERVTSRGLIARAGQRVTIGSVQLTLDEGGRIAGAGRAKVRLDLQGVALTVKDRGSGNPRALLDRVTMSIFPGELVGMLGPSGAGKSTLLMSVLGLLRPTAGGVLLNGKPLHQQYESFRTNVGYVPQDDIVHPQLTVREALWYACKLRLPPMPDADLHASIDRTLKQVGLFEQAELQIGSAEEKVLSGGQRRRVNLAVELVTDPSLLILDEPTSGLSWTDAADVVATLRRLADDGRTIVLTIHQPDFQEYEKFDSVAILGRGGKLLFFGPPSPDSYEFFGAAPHKPREMFDHVEQMPAENWRSRFEQSAFYQRFVVQRGPGTSGQPDAPTPKPRSRSSFKQFPVLLARSLQLTFRNKTALALLLLQAPLLGLLIGLTTNGSTSFRVGTFGCNDTHDRVDYCTGEDTELFQCDAGVVSDELLSRMPQPAAPLPGMMPTPPDPPDDLWDLATQGERRLYHSARIRDPRTGLLATLMALFLPMIIASSNVLVSERTIYERERLAGLNIIPYVLARFAVLCGLGAVVVTMNLLISLPLLGLHGNPMWYWLVGVMVTSAASATGLALSAAVRNPVSALWGINFLVIPQLLFAGSITRLTGFTWFVSWFTTTRYALEALTNVDLHARAHLQNCQIERYMENLPGFYGSMSAPLLYAATGTGTITFLCITATMILLRLKDKKVG